MHFRPGSPPLPVRQVSPHSRVARAELDGALEHRNRLAPMPVEEQGGPEARIRPSGRTELDRAAIQRFGLFESPELEGRGRQVRVSQRVVGGELDDPAPGRLGRRVTTPPEEHDPEPVVPAPVVGAQSNRFPALLFRFVV